MPIFQGQTKLTIRVNTKADLTGLSSGSLRYKKPGTTGSTGILNCTTHTTTGWLKHVVSSTSEMDTLGLHTAWAYLKYSDGNEAAGRPFQFRVYREGEVV